MNGIYDFGNLEIGRLDDDAYNFRGIVEDVRIYSDALSPDHIQALNCEK